MGTNLVHSEHTTEREEAAFQPVGTLWTALS